MRIWMAAVAVAVASMSISGWAQQNGHLRVKHSAPERVAKKNSAPIAIKSGNAGNANAKDLQALEHQTAKSSGPRTASNQRAAKIAPLKQTKEKSNPPINLGSGGGGGGSLSRTSSNPYKGRLKQKYAH